MLSIAMYYRDVCYNNIYLLCVLLSPKKLLLLQSDTRRRLAAGSWATAARRDLGTLGFPSFSWVLRLRHYV